MSCAPPALEGVYRGHIAARTAMSLHLPVLRSLAGRCRSVAEFGVKGAGSSSALLMGCDDVTSYDVVPTRSARLLQELCPHWKYRIESSLLAPPIACDLLFVDSLHTFEQCDGELRRHAGGVRQWLVFHDTITFGSWGAIGETGQMDRGTLGIRPAIDELMIRDPSWQLYSHDVRSHGLLVLRRHP